MKKTLITLTLLATLANADFTRNGDIVTDNTTHLQWQDDTTATLISFDWQAAITHCENLSLDSHTDWRLPNIRELKSIVDRSQSAAPIIYSAFQNTTSNSYWSATTVVRVARAVRGVSTSTMAMTVGTVRAIAIMSVVFVRAQTVTLLLRMQGYFDIANP